MEKDPNRSPYGLPLPTRIVQVLTEEAINGRKLLIMGDVHGCYDELAELLANEGVNKENTCVVFVGDLVNKGPKSTEVVEFVMSNGWYSVRGNHDEVCLRELMLASRSGEDPIEKYKWVTGLKKESAEWLQDLPYAIKIPSRNIVVVHAGLLPGTSLEEQETDFFLHMRCIKRAETGWVWTRDFNDTEYKLWGSEWTGPEHVYFGHDARRLLQQHEHATGLDTGCVYGKQLTGVYPGPHGARGEFIMLRSHRNYGNKDINKPKS